MLASCLVTLQLLAQTPSEQIDALKTEVIPPSPEAASLGKYADYPVSKYTGLPQISVDFYEINTGNISVPISLSYHAGGVKVEEIPSRIGLGWSLNAGGVITRSMRGGAYDEMAGYRYSCPNGDYDQGICTTDGGYFYGNDPITGDPEPDLFFYNVGGVSGKFIFKDQNTIQLTPYRNIEITPTLVGDQITAFEIKTENGLAYTFDVFEKQHGIPFRASTNGNEDKKYATAWYLSRIDDPQTGKSVSFHYKTLNSIVGDTQTSATFSAIGGNYMPGCCLSGTANLLPKKAITTVYDLRVIDQIDFEHGHIKFYSNTARQDYVGDYAISKLEIYNQDDLLKSFVLDQDYAHKTGQTTEESKRLYLKGVTETGSDGSAKPSYLFSYDHINELPARDSYQKDIFGYYKPSSATDLQPTIYAYPDYGIEKFSVLKRTNYTGSEYIISGNDRSPDLIAMKYGSLTKITYPTGGYTEFELEAHEFQKWNENFRGAGLRIKKKTDVDGMTNKNIVWNYSYRLGNGSNLSSGGIAGMLEYAFLCNAQPNGMNLQDYYTNYLVMKDRNQAVLGQTQGSHVGYSEVTVNQTGLGKTVSYFVSPLETPDLPAIQPNNNNTGQTSCPQNLWSVLDESNYPFWAGTSLEERRGLLLNEKVYNEAQELLQETTNTYELKSFGSHVVNLSSAFDHVSLRVGAVIVDGSYTVNSEATVLKTQSTKVYDPTNGQVSETIQEYTYNDHLQVKSVKTFEGNGAYTIAINTYPSDYTIPYAGITDDQTLALKEMVDNTHFLEPVIEQKVWRKDVNSNEEKLAFSILKNYEKHGDGFIALKNAEIITTNTPIAHYNYMESLVNSNGDFLKDSKYDTEMEYIYQGGKLLEIKDKSGFTKSFIWGYAGQDVTVSNPNYTEIAFTDFEEEVGSVSQVGETRQMGNWIVKLEVNEILPPTVQECIAAKNTCYTYCECSGSPDCAQEEAYCKQDCDNEYDDCIEASNQPSTFEDITWATGRNSAKSYKGTQITRNNLPNANYKVTFWAKGAGTISINGQSVNITSSWQEYEVTLNSITAVTLLSTTSIQIDGLQLLKATDYQTCTTCTNGTLPIAKVTNATSNSIAYTSFEGNIDFSQAVNNVLTIGNWEVTVGTGTSIVSAESKTGVKHYIGNQITKSNLPVNDYHVSFWAKGGGIVNVNGQIVTTTTEWKEYKFEITNSTNVTIQSSGAKLDELRLHPKNAQMLTYTYIPLVGTTSVCDINGGCIYYEYDTFGRLLSVKDEDGNLVQAYEYHFGTN